MSPETPALRLVPPDFAREAGVAALMAALGEARFVGGAVRDLLLGRKEGDLDIATPLLPAAVAERLAAAGIRTVPTGLAHGTLSAILPNCETGANRETGPRKVEITTLRRDVETDGRHAFVAFTEDWRADASRRDFTINALYLDLEGGIYDYFEGIDDARNGRVRFVGVAATRIAEDFLRILRYYRFFAHFGRGQPDADARAACRRHAGALPLLSAERVRSELLKLLDAPNPLPSLAAMVEDGIWAALFSCDEAALPGLARLLTFDPSADPILRLATLLPRGAAREVASRLKLSNAARARLEGLDAEHGRGLRQLADRAARYRLGDQQYRDFIRIAVASGDDPVWAARLLAEADRAPMPQFPLRGADLVAGGLAPSPAIGRILAEVERWWIDGGFQADRAACLARAQHLASGPDHLGRE